MKRTAFVLTMLAAFGVGDAAAQEGERISHGFTEGRPFSQAVQVGNMFWLSGKLGVNRETREMTEGKTAAETHNILQAFQEQLAEFGMDLSNTVRGTVYLTDVATFQEFNAVWLEYFKDDAPTRVTVAVAGLVAGASIEISFVAVKD